MRLLYEIRVGDKTCSIGRIAGAPDAGDVVRVDTGGSVERFFVRDRCWQHKQEPDAEYTNDLNCVVLNCERVEGGAR